MKVVGIVATIVALVWIYAVKKEDQLRKYEQLDHGEEV